MQKEPRQQWPLWQALQSVELQSPTSDQLMTAFLKSVETQGLSLYEAQEEAILELYSGKNLILNTPTGSGKSLVAASLHFESLGRGRRSVYTCPIKALVNEKFLALCRDFGPDQVGMSTGDATVNRDAPILCCTAEILANMALRDGANARVDDVIMDEFHYYSDKDRGSAWQIPLLALPRSRFLLMSATLGDTDLFERCMTELNGFESVTVRSTHRPVPLDFEYSELPLHETIARLITRGRAPIYVVNFSQRESAERAQDLMSTDFCTKDEKKAIATELEGASFASPYGKEIQKVLKHGIGLHHAGLLPKYRILVERLAQKGHLKIISGTDTLGVGVNVPIRTVLFTQLCKFDGQKSGILSVRDFHQISGRAGRRGFDDLGTVVAQAPEHVVENLRNEQKAAGDAKKLKKLVKRKPPEKGYVAWSKETFEKLRTGKPEALVSRFEVTHGMLLSVLSRQFEDGCRAMSSIIHRSHETPVAQRRLGKKAFVLFRSLVERKIVEILPPGSPTKLRVNVDLQEDFSLNHALSLYLLDTLKLLDPQSPDYALDALTLVESILENPEMVLRRQLDRIKGEKIGELKAQGMEYDERMEELDKLEYPKPRREFIYDTFNAFAASHPWVGQENIRPKSIAREMFETFQSFSEYVREYDLHRIEGQLLRYLSDVYKVIVQTVPELVKDAAPNDELRSIEEYFGTMIRGIDSSLLDEWERLRNPDFVRVAAVATEPVATGPKDITQDRRAFAIAIRNEVFRLVRALASQDWDSALDLLRRPTEWTVDSLSAKLEQYRQDHGRIKTDPEARAPKHLSISPEDSSTLRVTQVLVDAEGHNDWVLELALDLDSSREAGKPMLKLKQIGAI